MKNVKVHKLYSEGFTMKFNTRRLFINSGKNGHVHFCVYK